MELVVVGLLFSVPVGALAWLLHDERKQGRIEREALLQRLGVLTTRGLDVQPYNKPLPSAGFTDKVFDESGFEWVEVGSLEEALAEDV